MPWIYASNQYMPMHTLRKRTRVATYNIHKCRGLDLLLRPDRIVKVLRELDADIIALQEVCSVEGAESRNEHAEFIAKELGMHLCFGDNRLHKGRPYGNAVLSRFPFRKSRNFDISTQGREPRGCLWADVALPGGGSLHVFNVHMGTAFLERRKQARKLVSSQVLRRPDLQGPCIMLGDFNEWTRGLTTHLLRAQFAKPNQAIHRNHSRSYPAVLPLLRLDHIYFDPVLRLERFTRHRTRLSLVASDHLPLVADFSLDIPVGNVRSDSPPARADFQLSLQN